MSEKISFDTTYAPSENVVAREVHGEFMIIPITSGIGDLEDEIFSLNETGQVVWKMLDGKKSLRKAVNDLEEIFDADRGQIKKNVAGIAGELLARRMLIAVS